MNWSVELLPQAEQKLADIWLIAADRKAITLASHALETRLRANPENEGESRPDGRRSL